MEARLNGTVLPSPRTADELAQLLHSTPAGAILRYEELPRARVPEAVQETEAALETLLGVAVTTHLYLNGGRGSGSDRMEAAAAEPSSPSRTLNPHTDPYDVLVLQLGGAKRWTVCLPDVHGGGEAGAALSPALQAQLYEQQHQHPDGCASFSDAQLQRMRCRQLELRPGQLLYLPKGFVHYAVPSGRLSAHLTIGLGRRGAAWADLLRAMLARQTASAPAANRQALQAVLEAALALVAPTAAGVGLTQPVPFWRVAQLPAAAAAAALEPALDERLDVLAAAPVSPLQALPASASALPTLARYVLTPRVLRDLVRTLGEGWLLTAVLEQTLAERQVTPPPRPLFAIERLAGGVSNGGGDGGGNGLGEHKLARSRRNTTVVTCPSFDCSCDGCCDSLCSSSCDSGCDPTCDSSCDSSCDGGCDCSCDGCDETDTCDPALLTTTAGIIVGSVIGGIVIVVFLVMLCTRCRHRCNCNCDFSSCTNCFRRRPNQNHYPMSPVVANPSYPQHTGAGPDNTSGGSEPVTPDSRIEPYSQPGPGAAAYPAPAANPYPYPPPPASNPGYPPPAAPNPVPVYPAAGAAGAGAAGTGQWASDDLPSYDEVVRGGGGGVMWFGAWFLMFVSVCVVLAWTGAWRCGQQGRRVACVMCGGNVNVCNVVAAFVAGPV